MARRRARPRILILMGVSGSGKTYLGRLLADALGWRFLDGDDIHPRENVEKMARGEALEDADRLPWLRELNRVMVGILKSGQQAVIACSALRKIYRDILRQGLPQVHFIFLKGDYALIAERLARRQGHFMPSSLLRSQFEALEEPTDALVVDVAQDAEENVRYMRRKLGL